MADNPSSKLSYDTQLLRFIFKNEVHISMEYEGFLGEGDRSELGLSPEAITSLKEKLLSQPQEAACLFQQLMEKGASKASQSGEASKARGSLQSSLRVGFEEESGDREIKRGRDREREEERDKEVETGQTHLKRQGVQSERAQIDQKIEGGQSLQKTQSERGQNDHKIKGGQKTQSERAQNIKGGQTLQGIQERGQNLKGGQSERAQTLQKLQKIFIECLDHCLRRVENLDEKLNKEEEEYSALVRRQNKYSVGGASFSPRVSGYRFEVASFKERMMETSAKKSRMELAFYKLLSLSSNIESEFLCPLFPTILRLCYDRRLLNISKVHYGMLASSRTCLGDFCIAESSYLRVISAKTDPFAFNPRNLLNDCIESRGHILAMFYEALIANPCWSLMEIERNGDYLRGDYLRSGDFNYLFPFWPLLYMQKLLRSPEQMEDEEIVGNSWEMAGNSDGMRGIQGDNEEIMRNSEKTARNITGTRNEWEITRNISDPVKNMTRNEETVRNNEKILRNNEEMPRNITETRNEWEISRNNEEISRNSDPALINLCRILARDTKLVIWCLSRGSRLMWGPLLQIARDHSPLYVISRALSLQSLVPSEVYLLLEEHCRSRGLGDTRGPLGSTGGPLDTSYGPHTTSRLEDCQPRGPGDIIEPLGKTGGVLGSTGGPLGSTGGPLSSRQEHYQARGPSNTGIGPQYTGCGPLDTRGLHSGGPPTSDLLYRSRNTYTAFRILYMAFEVISAGMQLDNIAYGWQERRRNSNRNSRNSRNMERNSRGERNSRNSGGDRQRNSEERHRNTSNNFQDGHRNIDPAGDRHRNISNNFQNGHRNSEDRYRNIDTDVDRPRNVASGDRPRNIYSGDRPRNIDSRDKPRNIDSAGDRPRNIDSGDRPKISGNYFQDAQIYMNFYKQNIAEKLRDIQSLINSLQPLSYRLEVMENIYSLLFLRHTETSDDMSESEAEEGDMERSGISQTTDGDSLVSTQFSVVPLPNESPPVFRETNEGGNDGPAMFREPHKSPIMPREGRERGNGNSAMFHESPAMLREPHKSPVMSRRDHKSPVVSQKGTERSHESLKVSWKPNESLPTSRRAHETSVKSQKPSKTLSVPQKAHETPSIPQKAHNTLSESNINPNETSVTSRKAQESLRVSWQPNECPSMSMKASETLESSGDDGPQQILQDQAPTQQIQDRPLQLQDETPTQQIDGAPKLQDEALTTQQIQDGVPTQQIDGAPTQQIDGVIITDQIMQDRPPSSQYGPPIIQDGPPIQDEPPIQDGPPSSQYGPPALQYGPPSSQYGPPALQYGAPSSQYGPPTIKYEPPTQQIDGAITTSGKSTGAESSLSELPHTGYIINTLVAWDIMLMLRETLLVFSADRLKNADLNDLNSKNADLGPKNAYSNAERLQNSDFNLNNADKNANLSDLRPKNSDFFDLRAKNANFSADPNAEKPKNADSDPKNAKKNANLNANVTANFETAANFETSANLTANLKTANFETAANLDVDLSSKKSVNQRISELSCSVSEGLWRIQVISSVSHDLGNTDVFDEYLDGTLVGKGGFDVVYEGGERSERIRRDEELGEGRRGERNEEIRRELGRGGGEREEGRRELGGGDQRKEVGEGRRREGGGERNEEIRRELGREGGGGERERGGMRRELGEQERGEQSKRKTSINRERTNRNSERDSIINRERNISINREQNKRNSDQTIRNSERNIINYLLAPASSLINLSLSNGNVHKTEQIFRTYNIDDTREKREAELAVRLNQLRPKLTRKIRGRLSSQLSLETQRQKDLSFLDTKREGRLSSQASLDRQKDYLSFLDTKREDKLSLKDTNRDDLSFPDRQKDYLSSQEPHKLGNKEDLSFQNTQKDYLSFQEPHKLEKTEKISSSPYFSPQISPQSSKGTTQLSTQSSKGPLHNLGLLAREGTAQVGPTNLIHELVTSSPPPVPRGTADGALATGCPIMAAFLSPQALVLGDLALTVDVSEKTAAYLIEQALQRQNLGSERQNLIDRQNSGSEKRQNLIDRQNSGSEKRQNLEPSQNFGSEKCKNLEQDQNLSTECQNLSSKQHQNLYSTSQKPQDQCQNLPQNTYHQNLQQNCPSASHRSECVCMPGYIPILKEFGGLCSTVMQLRESSERSNRNSGRSFILGTHMTPHSTPLSATPYSILLSSLPLKEAELRSHVNSWARVYDGILAVFKNLGSSQSNVSYKILLQILSEESKSLYKNTRDGNGNMGDSSMYGDRPMYGDTLRNTRDISGDRRGISMDRRDVSGDRRGIYGDTRNISRDISSDIPKTGAYMRSFYQYLQLLAAMINQSSDSRYRIVDSSLNRNRIPENSRDSQNKREKMVDSREKMLNSLDRKQNRREKQLNSQEKPLNRTENPLNSQDSNLSYQNVDYYNLDYFNLLSQRPVDILGTLMVKEGVDPHRLEILASKMRLNLTSMILQYCCPKFSVEEKVRRDANPHSLGYRVHGQRIVLNAGNLTNFENLTGNIGNLTGNTGNLTGNTGNLTGNTENLTGITGNFTDNSDTLTCNNCGNLFNSEDLTFNTGSKSNAENLTSNEGVYGENLTPNAQNLTCPNCDSENLTSNSGNLTSKELARFEIAVRESLTTLLSLLCDTIQPTSLSNMSLKAKILNDASARNALASPEIRATLQDTADISQVDLGKMSEDVSQVDLRKPSEDVSQVDLSEITPKAALQEAVDVSQVDLSKMTEDVLQVDLHKMTEDVSQVCLSKMTHKAALRESVDGLRVDLSETSSNNQNNYDENDNNSQNISENKDDNDDNSNNNDNNSEMDNIDDSELLAFFLNLANLMYIHAGLLNHIFYPSDNNQESNQSNWEHDYDNRAPDCSNREPTLDNRESNQDNRNNLGSNRNNQGNFVDNRSTRESNLDNRNNLGCNRESNLDNRNNLGCNRESNLDNRNNFGYNRESNLDNRNNLGYNRESNLDNRNNFGYNRESNWDNCNNSGNNRNNFGHNRSRGIFSDHQLERIFALKRFGYIIGSLGFISLYDLLYNILPLQNPLSSILISGDTRKIMLVESPLGNIKIGGQFGDLRGQFKPVGGQFTPENVKSPPGNLQMGGQFELMNIESTHGNMKDGDSRGQYKPIGGQYKPEGGQCKPVGGQSKPIGGQFYPRNIKTGDSDFSWGQSKPVGARGQYKPVGEQYNSEGGQYKPEGGQCYPEGGQYNPIGGQYSPLLKFQRSVPAKTSFCLTRGSPVSPNVRVFYADRVEEQINEAVAEHIGMFLRVTKNTEGTKNAYTNDWEVTKNRGGLADMNTENAGSEQLRGAKNTKNANMSDWVDTKNREENAGSEQRRDAKNTKKYGENTKNAGSEHRKKNTQAQMKLEHRMNTQREQKISPEHQKNTASKSSECSLILTTRTLLDYLAVHPDGALGGVRSLEHIEEHAEHPKNTLRGLKSAISSDKFEIGVLDRAQGFGIALEFVESFETNETENEAGLNRTGETGTDLKRSAVIETGMKRETGAIMKRRSKGMKLSETDMKQSETGSKQSEKGTKHYETRTKNFETGSKHHKTSTKHPEPSSLENETRTKHFDTTMKHPNTSHPEIASSEGCDKPNRPRTLARIPTTVLGYLRKQCPLLAFIVQLYHSSNIDESDAWLNILYPGGHCGPGDGHSLDMAPDTRSSPDNYSTIVSRGTRDSCSLDTSPDYSPDNFCRGTKDIRSLDRGAENSPVNSPVYSPVYSPVNSPKNHFSASRTPKPQSYDVLAAIPSDNRSPIDPKLDDHSLDIKFASLLSLVNLPKHRTLAAINDGNKLVSALSLPETSAIWSLADDLLGSKALTLTQVTELASNAEDMVAVLRSLPSALIDAHPDLGLFKDHLLTFLAQTLDNSADPAPWIYAQQISDANLRYGVVREAHISWPIDPCIQALTLLTHDPRLPIYMQQWAHTRTTIVKLYHKIAILGRELCDSWQKVESLSTVNPSVLLNHLIHKKQFRLSVQWSELHHTQRQFSERRLIEQSHLMDLLDTTLPDFKSALGVINALSYGDFKGILLDLLNKLTDLRTRRFLIDELLKKVDLIGERIFSGSVQSFRDSIQSFNGAIQSFQPNNGSVQSFRDSIQSFNGAIQSFNGAIQSFQPNNGSVQSFQPNNGSVQSFQPNNGSVQSFRDSIQSFQPYNHKRDRIPPQADRIHDKTDGNPHISDRTDRIPRKTDRIPHISDKMDRIPPKTDRIPHISDKMDRIPHISDGISHISDKTDIIPDNTDRIPHISEKMDRIPHISDKIDKNSDRIPNISDRIPHISDKTDRIPPQADRIPHISDKIDQNSDRIPNISDRSPHISDKIPHISDKMDRIPHISDKTDIIPDNTDRIPHISDKMDRNSDRIPHISDKMDRIPHISDKMDRNSDRIPHISDKTDRIQSFPLSEAPLIKSLIQEAMGLILIEDISSQSTETFQLSNLISKPQLIIEQWIMNVKLDNIEKAVKILEPYLNLVEKIERNWVFGSKIFKKSSVKNPYDPKIVKKSMDADPKLLKNNSDEPKISQKSSVKNPYDPKIVQKSMDADPKLLKNNSDEPKISQKSSVKNPYNLKIVKKSMDADPKLLRNNSSSQKSSVKNSNDQQTLQKSGITNSNDLNSSNLELKLGLGETSSNQANYDSHPSMTGYDQSPGLSRGVLNRLIEVYAAKSLDATGAQVSLRPHAATRGARKFIMPSEPPRRKDWVRDSDVMRCPVCEDAIFSLFCRRHHCRRCGRVACGGCTRYRLEVQGFGYARVCSDCYKQTKEIDLNTYIQVRPLRDRVFESGDKFRLKDTGASETGVDRSETGPYRIETGPKSEIGVTRSETGPYRSETGAKTGNRSETGSFRSETSPNRSETGPYKSETALYDSETGLHRAETDPNKTGGLKTETGPNKTGLNETGAHKTGLYYETTIFETKTGVYETIETVSLDSEDRSLSEGGWYLSSDSSHNDIIRSEFSFDYAPSLSLCLSLLKFHSSDREAGVCTLHLSHGLFKLVQIRVGGTNNTTVGDSKIGAYGTNNTTVGAGNISGSYKTTDSAVGMYSTADSVVGMYSATVGDSKIGAYGTYNTKVGGDHSINSAYSKINTYGTNNTTVGDTKINTGTYNTTVGDTKINTYGTNNATVGEDDQIDTPSEGSGTIDHTFILSMIRTLLASAKIRFGKIGDEKGIGLCEYYLNWVDILTMLFKSNYGDLIGKEAMGNFLLIGELRLTLLIEEQEGLRLEKLIEEHEEIENGEWDEYEEHRECYERDRLKEHEEQDICLLLKNEEHKIRQKEHEEHKIRQKEHEEHKISLEMNKRHEERNISSVLNRQKEHEEHETSSTLRREHHEERTNKLSSLEEQKSQKDRQIKSLNLAIQKHLKQEFTHMRFLRDSLVKKYQWELALEISTKVGLDTHGVWGAWGMGSLKAGDFPGARDRFARVLERPEKNGVLRSSILPEIIKYLETNPFRLDQGVVDRADRARLGMMCEPGASGYAQALVVLHRLNNLENIASGGLDRKVDPVRIDAVRNSERISARNTGDWRINDRNMTDRRISDRNNDWRLDTTRIAPKYDGYSRNGPKLEPIFELECKYYLALYGTHSITLQFFMRNRLMRELVEYLLNNQNMRAEIFTRDVLVPCLRRGSQGVLIRGLLAADPHMRVSGRLVFSGCRWLERQKWLNSLLSIQELLNDDLRAAMTLLRMYTENAGDFGTLLARNELILRALGHLQAHLDDQSKSKKKKNPYTLNMTPWQVNQTIDILTLQIDATKYLATVTPADRMTSDVTPGDRMTLDVTSADLATSNAIINVKPSTSDTKTAQNNSNSQNTSQNSSIKNSNTPKSAQNNSNTPKSSQNNSSTPKPSQNSSNDIRIILSEIYKLGVLQKKSLPTLLSNFDEKLAIIILLICKEARPCGLTLAYRIIERTRLKVDRILRLMRLSCLVLSGMGRLDLIGGFMRGVKDWEMVSDGVCDAALTPTILKAAEGNSAHLGDLVKLLSSDKAKMDVYIECGRLRSAYLIAVHQGSVSDVHRVKLAADNSGQVHIAAMCNKWLNNFNAN